MSVASDTVSLSGLLKVNASQRKIKIMATLRDNSKPLTTESHAACRRCLAIVERGTWMREHLLWHAELEKLEEPTTEFGFWDTEGRWNSNSRDW